MEGLEAVELKLSFVKSESADFRIESEYFKKEYRILKDKLLSIPHEKLRYFLKSPVQTGHTPSMQNLKYYEGSIKFIKTDNLRDNFIKPFFNHYLSEEGNKEIIRTSLKEQDIITTIIGATHDIIARSCIINKEILPANINQNIALIRVDNSKVRPGYLNVYLNTKFGKKYMHYLSRQMEQVNLNCREVEQVIVPLFSNDFQSIIEIKLNDAHKLLEESKIIYKCAESILLETIGLNNFKPISDPINIKNYKNSFLASGRLDSEYYQKKYEDYEKTIKTNSHGYTIVSNEYSLIKKISKKEKSSYCYIEIGDINVSDGSATYNLIETYELPANAKTEVIKGDILISKVRSNRGAVAIIDFDADNLIVSGAFTVLREKKSSVFSNETLKVLLRTSIYKDWLLKFNIGTQYPVIRDEDILNMPIPKIQKDIQESITNKVRQAQELKKQSDHLLETAKHAVEIAIEQNEQKALEHIENFQKIKY